MTPLSAWQNFYVIVGSAAAALTGLMFVAITLIAGLRDRRSSAALNAFGTPTLIHFCAALFIAALISVPWPQLWQMSIPLGASGLAALVYLAIVARRMHRQVTYQPVLEDWAFHVWLPMLAYVVLLVAAILLPRMTTLALFGIAASALLLIFIGIHNAWDTVTYIVIEFADRLRAER